MIRGAIIGRYMQQHQLSGLDLSNNAVKNLFFDAKSTCYLNAYLLSQQGNRTLPVPRSWFKDKDAELRDDSTEITVYDFSVNRADELESPKFVGDVIWGEFRDGQLVTADSAFSHLPKLRSCTLQQCRAFGENAEVMLWQTDEGFQARLVQDEKDTYILPEDQILWGTQADKELNGFTLVLDGQQGLRHAVPLIGIQFDKTQTLYRPLRLTVRHYIDTEEETGLARIYLSRLVNLTTKKELRNATKTYKSCI
ncbi:MAG: CRISPR-associated protein Csx19 [Rhizonema sp. PD38]|nr:CRISPR-associated protein Csx19 [Rhizonema sp. PD38]